jgi:hypothetical protein
MNSLAAQGSVEWIHRTSSCGLSVGGLTNKLSVCVHLATNCVATNIQEHLLLTHISPFKMCRCTCWCNHRLNYIVH